jgi:hypothetical protein
VNNVQTVGYRECEVIVHPFIKPGQGNLSTTEVKYALAPSSGQTLEEKKLQVLIIMVT